ncbi:hypothetical protein [Absidia glauca]|uniref:Uncharacterized protein n=1 Tax=Absidia glauca TaxID=4829 RepID=A0A163JXJ9_ABSGL|nr:hypothetical protein [Absidia glauca]
MAFDRPNSNDPSFHAGMHSTSTATAPSLGHPSMHNTMFQNGMGLAWPPSMDLHSVVSPTSPENTGLSSLPSPPSGFTKPSSRSSTTSAKNAGNNSGSATPSTNGLTHDNDKATPGATTAGGATSTAPLDMSKPYHSEWGVMKEQDFHPLTLKHQRDLEIIYSTGNMIADFYFWQANLGGYCMADMMQNIVVSSEGAFPLIRRIVEGAPHPGRRKKKRGPA